MSPDSNHLNFTFCAGCSRILILHSMAVLSGGWLLVAGGGDRFAVSLQKIFPSGEEENSPQSPHCSLLTRLQKLDCSSGACYRYQCSPRLLTTAYTGQPLQPATALVSPVSCPPSLATDNDEPSLEPALWSLVATPAAPNKFSEHAARHLGQVEQGTCYDSNSGLQL